MARQREVAGGLGRFGEPGHLLLLSLTAGPRNLAEDDRRRPYGYRLLLRIHPRSWRQRDGGEPASPLAETRCTPAAVVDLRAGR